MKRSWLLLFLVSGNVWMHEVVAMENYYIKNDEGKIALCDKFWSGILGIEEQDVPTLPKNQLPDSQQNIGLLTTPCTELLPDKTKSPLSTELFSDKTNSVTNQDSPSFLIPNINLPGKINGSVTIQNNPYNLLTHDGMSSENQVIEEQKNSSEIQQQILPISVQTSSPRLIPDDIVPLSLGLKAPGFCRRANKNSDQTSKKRIFSKSDLNEQNNEQSEMTKKRKLIALNTNNNQQLSILAEDDVQEVLSENNKEKEKVNESVQQQQQQIFLSNIINANNNQQQNLSGKINSGTGEKEITLTKTDDGLITCFCGKYQSRRKRKVFEHLTTHFKCYFCKKCEKKCDQPKNLYAHHTLRDHRARFHKEESLKDVEGEVLPLLKKIDTIFEKAGIEYQRKSKKVGDSCDKVELKTSDKSTKNFAEKNSLQQESYLPNITGFTITNRGINQQELNNQVVDDQEKIAEKKPAGNNLEQNISYPKTTTDNTPMMNESCNQFTNQSVFSMQQIVGYLLMNYIQQHGLTAEFLNFLYQQVFNQLDGQLGSNFQSSAGTNQLTNNIVWMMPQQNYSNNQQQENNSQNTGVDGNQGNNSGDINANPINFNFLE